MKKEIKKDTSGFNSLKLDEKMTPDCTLLEKTFIHISGVGAKRELEIWRKGIENWQDFLDRGEKLLGPHLYGLGKTTIKRSIKAYNDPKGLEYLARMIPQKEHWRFFPCFNKVAYLDIESCQDTEQWGGITVVGVYDGKRVTQYVMDRDLNEVNHALCGFDVVCTFSGTNFDLPVLKSVFSDMFFPPVHIDLRWLLKRLGYKGGLKRIEKMFELSRPQEINDLDGLSAVRLWGQYLTGEDKALETLCLYNAYDVINLKPLLEKGVERLKAVLKARAKVEV